MMKVKPLTEKEMEIGIEPTDTIDRIKERVEEKEGASHVQQRLIDARKQLADHKTAKDYNIEDGFIASRANREGSPCQQDYNSQGGDIEMHSGPSLPEDIWHHIVSLMSMRDAARAACVSRAFLHSWRCYPNLTFSHEALGLIACGKNESFYSNVDNILKGHSGIGVKKLKIHIASDYSAMESYPLNNWLKTAVTPGIEELTLILDPVMATYNFPFSLLSNRSGDSIQCIRLVCCSFRPKVTLGYLRSLIRLHLCFVRISDDELGCVFSSCIVLERLELRDCNEIVCLKAPCLLQRLNDLKVSFGAKLRVIDIEAPNLSSFSFEGRNTVQLSFGETLKLKNLFMYRPGSVLYARTELPSSMRNLEALTIHSLQESADAPLLHSKFIHLRHLTIGLIGFAIPCDYDYLSLASFFDAAPSLETFNLEVSQRCMKRVSIFENPSDLRQMRELHHHNLKAVKITGFCSSKSVIELTCHILECITSVECLTLEAPENVVWRYERCNKSGKCLGMHRDMLFEAQRSLSAIRTYIQPKVPPTVKLHLLDSCSCPDAVEL